jgi:tRNA (cmo5U34)-methyltransferase
MSTYRWNQAPFAAGYDQAASVVHPYYEELQDEIVRLVAEHEPAPGLLIDLGGGSGRLAEKLLQAFPAACVTVLDQSQPFLDLAAQRLGRFGPRARCIQARLQEDWSSFLPGPADVVISMSAIHHLEPGEKEALYRQSHRTLRRGGLLLNADEVRPADETEYFRLLSHWSEHMQAIVAQRLVPESIDDILHRWIERNVTHYAQPRTSGDDCHETIAVQLAYLRRSGFVAADSPWQRKLWAILRAVA